MNNNKSKITISGGGVNGIAYMKAINEIDSYEKIKKLKKDLLFWQSMYWVVWTVAIIILLMFKARG